MRQVPKQRNRRERPEWLARLQPVVTLRLRLTLMRERAAELGLPPFAGHSSEGDPRAMSPAELAYYVEIERYRLAYRLETKFSIPAPWACSDAAAQPRLGSQPVQVTA